jgi:hypothetical protein
MRIHQPCDKLTQLVAIYFDNPSVGIGALKFYLSNACDAQLLLSLLMIGKITNAGRYGFF